MSDAYQATYDAVRNAFAGTGAAVMNAATRGFDFSYTQSRIEEMFRVVAGEHERPSVLMRPVLSMDGNKWCALYGANLMEGVAGFGDSPAKAMWDFDGKWGTALTPEPTK